jgi:hypothetical protein
MWKHGVQAIFQWTAGDALHWELRRQGGACFFRQGPGSLCETYNTKLMNGRKVVIKCDLHDCLTCCINKVKDWQGVLADIIISFL